MCERRDKAMRGCDGIIGKHGGHPAYAILSPQSQVRVLPTKPVLSQCNENARDRHYKILRVMEQGSGVVRTHNDIQILRQTRGLSPTQPSIAGTMRNTRSANRGSLNLPHRDNPASPAKGQLGSQKPITPMQLSWQSSGLKIRVSLVRSQSSAPNKWNSQPNRHSGSSLEN